MFADWKKKYSVFSVDSVVWKYIFIYSLQRELQKMKHTIDMLAMEVHEVQIGHQFALNFAYR